MAADGPADEATPQCPIDLVDPQLVEQGAEARIFRGNFLGRHVIVKHRFPKRYRHPSLDTTLTKARLVAEVRGLVRARKMGLPCPCVLFVDETRGIIVMDEVDGKTMKEFLFSNPSDETARRVAAAMGERIARLHDADIIHGDLTTSNWFVRRTDNELVRCVPAVPVRDDTGAAHLRWWGGE